MLNHVTLPVLFEISRSLIKYLYDSTASAIDGKKAPYLAQKALASYQVYPSVDGVVKYTKRLVCDCTKIWDAESKEENTSVVIKIVHTDIQSQSFMSQVLPHNELKKQPLHTYATCKWHFTEALQAVTVQLKTSISPNDIE